MQEELYMEDMPYKNYQEYLNDVEHMILMCMEKKSVQTINQDMESRLYLNKSLKEYFPLPMIRKSQNLSPFSYFALCILVLGEISPNLHDQLEKKGYLPVTIEKCMTLYQGGKETSYIVRDEEMECAIRELELYFYDKVSGITSRARQELVCDVLLKETCLDQSGGWPKGLQEKDLSRDLGDIPYLYEKSKTRMKELETMNQDFILCGPSGSGKWHLMRSYLADKEEKYCLCLDLAQVDREIEKEVFTLLKISVRESMWSNRSLVIRHIDLLEGLESSFLSGVRHYKDTYGVDIFLIRSQSDTKEVLNPSGYFHLVIERLDEQERLALWQLYAKDNDWYDKVDIERTASAFDFGPQEIYHVSRYLSCLPKDKVIDQQELHQACSIELGDQDGRLQRIKAIFSWEDLKLDEGTMERLKAICDQVLYKNTVFKTWHFEDKLPYGRGVTALFAGSPGTGKTMAAQVLAKALAMELYRVDLSQLIDKYVGETEKNIRYVFEAVDRRNGILFFDEADAIFNKRLNASTDNERFSNIQSSLLLQLIESYEGVVILATNAMQAMDPAFMRRFKHYVPFREPQEEQRYHLWMSVFPKEVPMEENIDFRKLAQTFSITGAIIKNVALNASFMAAAKEKKVTMADIVYGVQKEMEKSHVLLSKDQLDSLLSSKGQERK